jgi:hypothetical protein
MSDDLAEFINVDDGDSKNPTPRRLIYLVIALLCILGFGVATFSVYSNSHEAQARREERERRDQAVDVLPPGVQEQWIEYVDKRVCAMINPVPGSIEIADQSKMGTTTLLSRNTPYKLTCTPGGGWVEFDGFDSGESTTVQIWPSKDQPAPEVSEFSIAAID